MADSSGPGAGTVVAMVGVTALLIGGTYAYLRHNVSKSKKASAAAAKEWLNKGPNLGDPAPGWYAMAYRAPGGDISKGRLKEGAGPLRTKKEAEDYAREYREAGYVPEEGGAVEVKYSEVYI